MDIRLLVMVLFLANPKPKRVLSLIKNKFRVLSLMENKNTLIRRRLVLVLVLVLSNMDIRLLVMVLFLADPTPMWVLSLMENKNTLIRRRLVLVLVVGVEDEGIFRRADTSMCIGRTSRISGTCV